MLTGLVGAVLVLSALLNPCSAYAQAAGPPGRRAAGGARLHIDYTGEISKKETSGIFAQREGADWYAFAHFEPTRARWWA